MTLICGIFVLLGAFIWLSILLLPWRPWSTREVLDAGSPSVKEDLSDITVLIPARDEAAMIQNTLSALQAQGHNLSIIVVDDQSTDSTAQTARDTAIQRLLVVSGQPLPPGWSGKLWAVATSGLPTPCFLMRISDLSRGLSQNSGRRCARKMFT